MTRASLAVLAVAFALTACGGVQGDRVLNYVPDTPPVIADSSASAMAATIPLVDSGILEQTDGESVNVDAVEMLRETQLGQVWSQSHLHRAFVVGHPAVCPYHRIAVDQPTAERASSLAMQGCVRYMEELSQQIGVDCQCRLAALNNTLLMAPAELPYRTELPTLVMSLRGANERTWAGLLSISGRTGTGQPLALRSLDGDVECVGTYDSLVPARGNFTASCSGTDALLEGSFRVLGNYKGNSFGFAAARNGEQILLIAFGLDERSFVERLRAWRAEEAYRELIKF